MLNGLKNLLINGFSKSVKTYLILLILLSATSISSVQHMVCLTDTNNAINQCGNVTLTAVVTGGSVIFDIIGTQIQVHLLN